MINNGVRTTSILLFVAVLTLLSTSCSSSESLHPVQGKVLHNGNPLPGALVTLHLKSGGDLKTIPSTGLSKEDGTFTIMTGDKTGAPAGEYVVTIICSEIVKPQPGVISTAEPESVDRLKGAYANKDNSKIVVQIKSGPNQLEPFDLK